MEDQDEILKLLDNQEELTPELIALIEEYRQVKEQGSNNDSPTTQPSYTTIGSQCAITFAFEQDLVLLPGIVLDSLSDDTVQVLILTPVTKDTVPCQDRFSSSTSCPNGDACPQSHGYIIPIEYVTSFDALGTTTNMVEQLQYGKRVWCKDPHEDVWKVGNIIDQLHGPRWRVRLRDKTKKRLNVDIEHIMPFKSITDEQYHDEEEEWSESDREQDEIRIEDGVIMDRAKDTFGGWQVHTKGFAAKMMKKMGYVEGQGLGLYGEGQVEPVQAYKSRRNENDRPGLGLGKEPKKKKGKKKQVVEDEEDDMFGLMNSLLDPKKAPPEHKPSIPKVIKFKNEREANQAVAKLQTDVNKAQAEYVHATEAYRRNKGSPMESQFRTKLKTATNKLEGLKKELSRIQHHVKQTKEKKDMYTF